MSIPEFTTTETGADFVVDAPLVDEEALPMANKVFQDTLIMSGCTAR